MPTTREPDHTTLKQVFSNQVRWVEPDTSVQTIAEIMRDLRLSCVVVCDCIPSTTFGQIDGLV